MRRAARPGPAGRAGLEDEAEFLARSLADLEREHSAGELGRADYEALRARYEDRASVIGLALEGLGTPAPADPSEAGTAPARHRPSRQRWPALRRHRLGLGYLAAACFAAAAVLLSLALAGVTPFAAAPSPALPVAARIRIELGEAGVLASNGRILQAVAVYDKVLELDPRQPQALADGGWLTRLAGMSAGDHGVIAVADAEIAAAAEAAPGYALARAYDGIALFEDDRRAAAAVGQFRAMLADHPSKALLEAVRPTAAAACRAAGVALPAALAGNPPASGSSSPGA